MPKEDTQFKKGHTKSGGRKKGVRNKLTNAYLKLLHGALDERGSEALEKTIDTRPDVLLKLIGALVPKDLDLKLSGDVTVQIVNYSDEDDPDKTEDD